MLSVIDDVRRKEEEDQVAQVADSVEQGLMEQMEQAQAEAEDELRKAWHIGRVLESTDSTL